MAITIYVEKCECQNDSSPRIKVFRVYSCVTVLCRSINLISMYMTVNLTAYSITVPFIYVHILPFHDIEGE